MKAGRRAVGGSGEIGGGESYWESFFLAHILHQEMSISFCCACDFCLSPFSSV